jgi:hypothetical protein
MSQWAGSLGCSRLFRGVRYDIVESATNSESLLQSQQPGQGPPISFHLEKGKVAGQAATRVKAGRTHMVLSFLVEVGTWLLL